MNLKLIVLTGLAAVLAVAATVFVVMYEAADAPREDRYESTEASVQSHERLAMRVKDRIMSGDFASIYDEFSPIVQRMREADYEKAHNQYELLQASPGGGVDEPEPLPPRENFVRIHQLEFDHRCGAGGLLEKFVRLERNVPNRSEYPDEISNTSMSEVMILVFATELYPSGSLREGFSFALMCCVDDLGVPQIAAVRYGDLRAEDEVGTAERQAGGAEE